MNYCDMNHVSTQVAQTQFPFLTLSQIPTHTYICVFKHLFPTLRLALSRVTGMKRATVTFLPVEDHPSPLLCDSSSKLLQPFLNLIDYYFTSQLVPVIFKVNQKQNKTKKREFMSPLKNLDPNPRTKEECLMW